MYFIKRIKGNLCTIGSLNTGESDIELTKQEVLDAVNHGMTVYGVVSGKLKDIQEATIEYLATRGVQSKRGKLGNVLIRCGGSMGFCDETWTNDGFLRINLWDVRNARKILGC